MAIKEKAGRKARLFIDSMEKYVSMLSDKGIKVVIGHAPATDGKGTIYLPHLSEDATHEQKVQWLAYAMHEQAHFHGASDPSQMPHKKMWHFCINAVDDIRVERLQEEAYPGIPETRRQAYQLDMDMFLSKELIGASASTNPKGFILTLLKYMILKNRVRQMKAPIIVEASPDVLGYYARYLEVYESRLDSISTFRESIDLGTEIYNLLQDIIKEALEPPKPDPKQDPDEDDDSDEGDPSEDDDSQSGSGDDEEDDSEEGSESGSKSDDEDSEDDDSKSGSGDGEESDDGDDEEDDSEEGSKSDDARDTSDEDDSESGSSDDESDDESESGSKSDDDESDEGEPSDEAGDPSEDGDDSDEGDSQSGSKSDEDLSEEAKDILDDLDDGDEDLKTLADKYKETLEDMASSGSDYSVMNGVKDEVSFNYETSDTYVQQGKVLLGAAGARMTRVFVSKSRESVDFNQHRGRFDMKAFVSDASDQRRDVFSSIRPGSLDKAAVSIAIDNSASMSGQRITKAYQILGGLLYYLDKAGVPVEAAGFTAKDCYDSDHRDAPVVISVVKTFDEPFKGHPVLRCHPPAYCNLTIELDCLKFLAPRLYKRPEGKKVLFVLSDGEPCTGNSNLTRKLVVAYKEYIARLREVGIIVVGFGIDTDVTEYFGTDCINTQTNNLGEEIVKKLTEILNRR